MRKSGSQITVILLIMLYCLFLFENINFRQCNEFLIVFTQPYHYIKVSSVFTHLASIYANLLEQKKAFA